MDVLRCRDAAPFLVQCENPLFRSFGARGFLFAFLLACLCELHRIRIVQAEMGLAGSRTSFSFPPNRKPSFLSAIFCICHHVCPLVHPILPVTAFGWQFYNRGCIFVVTVFLLSNFAGFAALGTTVYCSCAYHQSRCRGCAEASASGFRCESGHDCFLEERHCRYYENPESLGQ